jgi:addiction module HigA family antidote
MPKTPVISPIHPGEVLLTKYLEPRGVTQSRLAVATGVPHRRINEIVRGKRHISADTASSLARYFGTTQRFWLNLQGHYDLEVELSQTLDEIEASAAPGDTDGQSRTEGP